MFHHQNIYYTSRAWQRRKIHTWSDTFLLLLLQKKKSLKVSYLQKLFFNTQKKRYLTNIYLPPPEHLNCKYLFYIESSHVFGLNNTRTNPLLILVFGPKETKTPRS